MLTPSRLLTFAALATTLVSAGVLPNIVAPAFKGVPDSVANTLNLEGTLTDVDTILSTAQLVDQKDGPQADTPSDLPIADTAVTAVDGQLTEAGTAEGRKGLVARDQQARVSRDLPLKKKRAISDYEQVFSGTGLLATDRDGSIQGTAYLTFRILPNATYDVEGCLNFCSSEPKCVFANLYYEFNNERLDHYDGSNLKCAIYGDVHTAAEKTNVGGQQSYQTGNSLTYIQQSSGWAAKELVEPDIPEGYETVGPLGGANNAPGYMGFAFLDRYDVDACAKECNQRGADGNGGACQYFNIWRAVVNGDPTTYSCSMYFLVADPSTAVNTGQGDLKVTFSRGYKRQNYLVDGGFEGYTSDCNDFCYTESYSNWVATSPAGGYLDATVFYFDAYAHSGHGSALLGSATFADANAGTLTAGAPLNTTAGKKYQIAFFQNNAYSGPTFQAPSFVEVLWNGKVVQTFKPGYSAWKFSSVDVVATGGDVLAFRGGAAPAWTFLDDIAVWPLFQ